MKKSERGSAIRSTIYMTDESIPAKTASVVGLAAMARYCEYFIANE